MGIAPFIWSVSPRLLLILLLLAGLASVALLRHRTPSSPKSLTSGTSLMPTTPVLDSKAEIARLEEMVEHLEEQNKALTEENTALIQKLGSLGMNTKGAVPAPEPMAAKPDAPADYVALGNDLLKLREVQNLPMPTMTSTEDDVKAAILAWLKKIHAPDHGMREGNALHALGLIPEPIDTIGPRAALMARQITGWYDESSGTMLVIPPHKEPGGTLISTEPPLAIAYGNLLHHFGDQLFGKDFAAMTTDERQARFALLGGDAALTRFLHELVNHSNPDPDTVTLPPDDPDHPLNQILIPDFLRQRDRLPMTEGFEFAQTLHSIAGWPQVAGAYQRPPESTAEIMDSERYLGDTRMPPIPITVKEVKLKGRSPVWDDRLGQHTLLLYLRRYLEPELALPAAAKWRGDRFLVYPGADSTARGSAHWHIVTSSRQDAQVLLDALRSALLYHYELPEGTPLPHTTSEGRMLSLTIENQTVTLTDDAP